MFGVTLPPGYRNWQFVSIAHEEGDKPDIRVILGNDVAMKAFRDGTLPFPDGTIIARLAYKYESSAQNNAAFGREQSFIAGSPPTSRSKSKTLSVMPARADGATGSLKKASPIPVNRSSMAASLAIRNCPQRRT